MLEKYRATIHGNTIEWEGEAPGGLENDRTIIVEVTPVKESPLKKGDGKRAAEALRKIAARGGVRSIKDPSEWQREIRKDRPLPGRD